MEKGERWGWADEGGREGKRRERIDKRRYYRGLWKYTASEPTRTDRLLSSSPLEWTVLVSSSSMKLITWRIKKTKKREGERERGRERGRRRERRWDG